MKCEFNWPENINEQYRHLIKYYDLIKTHGFSIDPLSYDFVYSHIPVGRLYKANDELLPGKIFKEVKEESTFYIHIPFCQRCCAYCYFVKEPFNNLNALDEYLGYLEKEVNIIKQLIKTNNIKSIYIGGGSPSILDKNQIEFLFNNIIGPIKTDGIEIAVELHPENTTQEKLETLKGNGVTRVSLGVQTFDDTILRRMNRYNGNLNEVIMLVKNKFNNWNVDMIYGLPGQTPCIIEKDIEKILQYNPPSLTWYQLWYAPRKKDHQILMSKFPREAFMSREEIIKTRLLIDTKMQDNNYKNFSGEWYVKDDNNYTTYERFKIEAKGNIGIGLGIYQYYGDYIFENTEDLNEYKNCLDKNILPIKWYRRMSPAEKTIRKICMNMKGLDEAGSIDEGDLVVLKTGFQDYKIEKFLEKINILKDKGILISDNNCQYKLNQDISILRDYIIIFLLKESGWYIEREGYGESLNKIDIEKAIESFVCYAKANFRQDVRWSISLFFGIFDDTRNKFDLFFSKNYKNVDRGIPEITQYREPKGNDFSFLKVFYLPPSYISGPVCIVCRHSMHRGKNISLDVPFIKVENEFKSDDINQFLKSILIFEDVDNKSLTYVNNYYLDYLPKALALKENETFFVFHIPFFEALGIGGIELAINRNLSRDQLNNMRDLLIPYFADRLSLEINRYSNHIYRLHALKNALASIMARNMSHNIDSHVSPRARLDQVRARLTELNGCPNSIEVLETLKNRLDEYRQKRSDFLAEITSDPLLTTKSVWFYKDIIIPLIQNTLFMDNIAKNEGICYENKNKFYNALTIRVRIKGKDMSVAFKSTNDTVKYPDQGYPYDNLLNEDLISFYTLGDPDSDVEIEVPGPVGEHAFYGFLENFIRNSAKHNQLELSGSKNNKVLKVDIEITDPNDEAEMDNFYLVKISDNISVPNKQVSLKIDGKECKTLIDVIRAYIKTPIIDGSGKKRDLAYGLSEMKIDAALLRGSVDFMNMENFLDVRADSGKLFYEFKLMKPKKLCLVMNLDMNDKKETISNLKKNGIWVFNSIDEVNNLFAFTDSHENLNSVLSFKFVLVDCSNLDPNNINNLIQLMHNFPFRVILLNYCGNDNILSNASRVLVLKCPEKIDELKQIISDKNKNNNNGEIIMEWVWANWLTRWKIGNADHKVLDLYLEQNANESPTKEWEDSTGYFNEKNRNYKLSLHVWKKVEDKIIPWPQDIGNDINTIHIYYDRHGAIFQGRGRDRQFSFGSDSYNLLDKLNKDFPLIFAANPLKQKTLIYELIESGLLRILVIDERLAERSVEQVSDTNANVLHYKVYHDNKFPRLWHIASAANIYICTHFGCNETNVSPLHANSYEREIRIAQDGISPVPKLTFKYNNGMVNVSYQIQENNGSSTELQNIDMLVIHQGIIDKKLNGVSADEFFDNISNFIPWVIIESGRGIPSNLPKYIKFLPYSIIDDLISNKRIAKYRLSQLVMSLSKQKG